MIKKLCWFTAALAMVLETGVCAEGSATNERPFLSRVRQLVFEGRRSGEGYFSADGQKLIFQSERDPANPFYQIYLLDFASGQVTRVSPGHGKTTCGFIRPGAREILFASTHLDPSAREKQKAELEFRASGQQRRYAWDYDEQMDIFSAKPDGSGLRQLTRTPGYDAEGAYSPDGRQIVFCSLRSGYPTNKLSVKELGIVARDPSWFGDIYLMKADGSDQKRLTFSPGYDGGPFFSPDGARIVWRRFNEEGTVADVFTMKADGTDRRQVTNFKAVSWAPYYHPSGQYLIFTANKEGFSNFELYLVGLDGSHEPVRVTHTDGFDGLPVFSPAGNQLAWSSSRQLSEGSQIFLANWNHQAALEALDRAEKRKVVVAIPSNGETLQTNTVVLSPPVPGSQKALRETVSFLASDDLQGRMTGSEGARKAADFLADQFKKIGLRPWGSNGFFHSFDFSAGVNLLANQTSFQIISPATNSLELGKDYLPLSFSSSGEWEGPLVLAGYGLTVPASKGAEYDSYGQLEVSNKIVLVLRYSPEEFPPARRQELNRYASLRYKATVARQHGAKGIIVVGGPNSPGTGEPVQLAHETSASDAGILAISLSRAAAERMLSASGVDLKKWQSSLDQESPHGAAPPMLSNVVVKIKTSLEPIRKTDRNVVGYLPPGRPSPETKGEMVVLGGHYDHLGLGETGGFEAGQGLIHAGADDNASGTAAILELARLFAARQKSLKRGLLFGLWSGEEIGLIGSSAFLEQGRECHSNMVAYLNFDMVGRLKEDRLQLQGVGSSPAWRGLLERRNVAAGFNLILQEDPWLPTDVTAFYPKGVPVLSFFTGSHEDYHRSTDRPEKINYEGLSNIVRFAEGVTEEVANGVRLPYAVVQGRASGGGRENLRAYLGTIPDYATEQQGVKLSGVRPGSPAEKGGLKGGDVLVEFAGQKIANIYDYTYALDAVKIGKEIEAVVLREGKRVTLHLTPELRK